MRIWYQGLIPRNESSAAYYASMEAHAAALVRPDTTVEFHGMPEHIYPRGYGPAEFTRYLAGEWVEVCAFAGMVLEAERAGFDAVMIGTLQEPGLQLARTLTDLPVVGYGQAASFLGRSLGERVGVLAFNEALFPLFRDRLNVHIPDSVGPIRSLDVTYAEIHASFRDPDLAAPLRSAIEDGCRLLAREGASAIVPGQMLLAEAAWRLGVRRVDDTPVIDALGALVLFAETLVLLRRTSGITVSRRGFTWAKADPVVAQALAALVERERG